MTRITVSFLGTTASIPTKYRNHAAIYLTYQSENEHCFLWDCGEGTQRQIFLAGLNFMRLDHIFITHWHADHFAGLFGLLETMSLEKRKKPLYLYGPEASKFFEVLAELGYSSKGFAVNPIDAPFDSKEKTILLEDEEYQIVSVPVNHGIPAVAYAFIEKDRVKIDKKKAASLGLPKKGPIYKKLKRNGEIIYKGKKILLKDVSFIERGKKVVYSGDTRPCASLVSIAKDADLLIHECTYFDNDFDERNHSSIEDIVKIAKETKAKQIVLTHISRRYQSIKELQKIVEKVAGDELKGKIKIAKDFMTLKIE